MKGIELNKQQLEAYQNGATMFMIPIEVDISQLHTNLIKDKKYFIQCVIETYAPLQKGDKFFIKEEFSDLGEYRKVDGVKTRIVYNDNFHEDGTISIASCNDDGSKFVNVTNDYFKSDLFWEEPSEMKENQARLKDIVLDVKFKKVGEILLGDVNKCGLSEELCSNKFPYKTNDYVFLYTIDGVNK